MVEIVCLNTKCKFNTGTETCNCTFVVHVSQYFVIDRKGKCNYLKIKEEKVDA